MKIHTEKVSVTTTGSDGSATGSSNSTTLVGFVQDVYLDYHASCPATADVTLAYADMSDSILVVTDNATDGRFAPRQKMVDNANAAITNSHDKFAVNGKITVSVAGANALTNCVVAYIRVLEV